LVAASPNDDVGINKIWRLFFYGLCLHKAKSFLLAISNVLVELLGISSEPSEGVEVSLLVSEIALLKVGVPISLGIRYFLVKHFNIITVKNRDRFNF
jgi:uncharacterized membrane-anchored protein